MLNTIDDDNNSIISYVSINNCSICLSSLDKEQSLKSLKCTHIFHNDCINTWLNKNTTCPICRTIIEINTRQISLPAPINNNHNYHNNHNNHNNYSNNYYNIFYIITVILFVLACLFHLCSSIYNTYVFLKTNNEINNNLKIQNDTLWKNNNTYDASILIMYDCGYYLIFIISNIFILNKIKCCCSPIPQCIFLTILLITGIIVRGEFFRSTRNFIENIYIDNSYYNNLVLSITLYYSSCALKFAFCGLMYMCYVKLP